MQNYNLWMKNQNNKAIGWTIVLFILLGLVLFGTICLAFELSEEAKIDPYVWLLFGIVYPLIYFTPLFLSRQYVNWQIENTYRQMGPSGFALHIEKMKEFYNDWYEKGGESELVKLQASEIKARRLSE